MAINPTVYAYAYAYLFNGLYASLSNYLYNVNLSSYQFIYLSIYPHKYFYLIFFCVWKIILSKGSRKEKFFS